MADLRRGKTKRKQLAKDDNSEKPSKEEYAVAKYLRFNAPRKEGKFLGNSVQYFIGSRAVDTLLESKWSAKNTKTNALFTNRISCTNYCERLLEKGFFHRVARPEKRDKKRKLKETPADKGPHKEERKQEKRAKKDEPGESKKEKETEQKDKKDKDLKTGDEYADAQREDSGEDKKRKKKKLKLEMHDKQIFIDSSDLYVWIYDPVPVKTFVIGLFLVLGAIAVCLFPLWPPEVKLGVYYLSLAGAGFIGVILSLCILRMILFVIVWVLTLGKISFWLLPNLTEDVGFFESFRPAYKCEFKDASKKEDKGATDEAGMDGDAAAGNDEAENQSDGEEAGENAENRDNDQTKEDGGSEEEEDEEDERQRVDEDEDENEEPEHDQEDNGHSGSSNDNGYEIVDADDVLGQADLEGSEDEDQAQQTKSEKRSKKVKTPESKKTK